MAAQGHCKGDEDPHLANMWAESDGAFLAQLSGKAEVPPRSCFSNTMSLTFDTLASENSKCCLDLWEVEREREGERAGILIIKTCSLE